MTITQVLYALETARCQNVSKAAERMFVSQPALSAQLGKLEEELGCKLFRRGHQGVSLTAAGVSFCQTAEAVEAAWRELQESTRNLQNAVCRQIRIGMGPRALSNGLVDALLSFFDQHPETEVSFITDIGEDMLTALEEGRLDMAVDRLPPPSGAVLRVAAAGRAGICIDVRGGPPLQLPGIQAGNAGGKRGGSRSPGIAG